MCSGNVTHINPWKGGLENKGHLSLQKVKNDLQRETCPQIHTNKCLNFAWKKHTHIPQKIPKLFEISLYCNPTSTNRLRSNGYVCRLSKLLEPFEVFVRFFFLLLDILLLSMKYQKRYLWKPIGYIKVPCIISEKLYALY